MRRWIKGILVLLCLLLCIPIGLFLIGWLFSHSWGYYVALACISVISFIGWRQRTERFGGGEYLGLKSRIEWLQEKDNPFKRR